MSGGLHKLVGGEPTAVEPHAQAPVPQADGAATVEPASSPATPYPQFCHTPAECAGLGSCPRDIACNH